MMVNPNVITEVIYENPLIFHQTSLNWWLIAVNIIEMPAKFFA